MRATDTLIIGSGYAALGYAVVHPDTLIVEERELCDTSFCFPQRGYDEIGAPTDSAARELYEYYAERGLVRDGRLNVGALEMGMCSFMLDRGVRVLLKCRAVSVERTSEQVYFVTLINGAGIEHVTARRVIDMRPVGDRKTLTVLFTADPEAADEVSAAFPEGSVTPAFYEGRYALTLPASREYIEEKRRVIDRWRSAEHGARLLYIAPALAQRADRADPLRDSYFDSPFDAFSAGVEYAREVK